MLFPTWEYVVRVSREIRRLPPVEVSDELRGWSWGESTITSSQEALLGVSDITSGFCPTGRDVYLRYVERVREDDNAILQKGRLIHEIFERAVELVKQLIYEHGSAVTGDKLEEGMKQAGKDFLEEVIRRYPKLSREFKEWLFRRLWGEAVRTYSAALDAVKSRSKYLRVDSLVAATVPVIAEFPIDGSLIGLSRALRIDALLPPSLIMEIKTRTPRREFELSLAGYALAMESQYEIPVDHGILLYVHVDWGRREVLVRPKIVPISEGLREEFIEYRDERKEIVIYGMDPGIPKTCRKECPFIKYCSGEGG